MSDSIPVTVGVWAKRPGVGAGWGKVSEVRTWQDLSLEPRFNQPGTWSLRLPYDTQSSRLTKNHLLTFDFRGTRMTGVIEKLAVLGDESGAPMLEVSGPDALTFLGDVQCWPDPASPLDAQNVVRYYASGQTETVLRALIVANMVTRRGDDVVVAASLGRGIVTVLNEEFTNLLTVVLAKCEAAGLGVRMGLVDTTSSTRAEMRVEFFTPVDRSNRVRLSHNVGTLRSWKQEDNAPTGTRVVLVAAREETRYGIASESVSANTFTITPPAEGADDHRFKTGSVVHLVGSGVPAPPLKFDNYFAIRVSSDTFKLATTRANASKGVAIDITAAHTGVVDVIETKRRFREYMNTAVEAEWSRRREMYVSASISDDDVEATYTNLGNEALAEVTAQSGFELETAEAEGMRYGTHYGLGDLVTVELLTGVSKVDRLGAMSVTASTDSGLTVRAIPGNPDAVNPMFGQAAIVRGIRRQVQALERKEP